MASALPVSGWERTGLMRVTARGPFAVGSVEWRDARGQLVGTIVAKATYKLGPEQAAPVDVPLPIQEEDVHWDDDPSRSVHVPSDLAPFKAAAEVVVVGSAFVPNSRPRSGSLLVRVIVGSVDKSLEIFPPRSFRIDGSIEDAVLQRRLSLRYEHAAGGPDTDNLAGIQTDRADASGRLPIPQILPPLHKLGARGDFIPTAGFGPIAATWTARAGLLSAQDRAWLRRPMASALPQTWPPKYFQVAPQDQWLDRAFVPNEQILLDGLHATHPRLSMSLSGLEPRAFAFGAAAQQIRLSADLLVIDTDRSLCTLTYRGHVALDEGGESTQVIVLGMPMGAAISTEDVQQLFWPDAEEVEPDFEMTATDAHALRTPPPIADAARTQSAPMASAVKTPALPFSTRPSGPAALRQSFPDGALPFRQSPFLGPQAPPASEPPSRVQPSPVSVPPAPAPPLPIALPAAPERPPSIQLSAAPEPPLQIPLSSAPEPPRPAMMSPGSVAESPPKPASAARAGASFDAAFGGAKMTAKSFDAAFGRSKTNARPAAPESSAPPARDAVFGGVKAASDAAADKERAREPEPSRDGAARAADQPLRRLAVVDLLHLEPKVFPRVRAMRRFAGIWGPPARGRGVSGVDEVRAEVPSEERERAEILRLLSCASPETAAEVRRTLADSLDDTSDFGLPIALVSGDLCPLFDEIETLRATVSIAQPIAGGDKKLLATLAVAQEALSAPIAPRPDTALGLARQIDQATASLSLPQRYIASEVERVLLEGRKYKRRTLLGASRVRADLTLARGGDVLPFYIPDSVAASLPMLLAYPVVALCELRPREDMTETHAEALFPVALGRVLHSRSEG